MTGGGKAARKCRQQAVIYFFKMCGKEDEMRKGALKERLFQERGLLVFAGRGWQYSYKKYTHTHIYIYILDMRSARVIHKARY